MAKNKKKPKIAVRVPSGSTGPTPDQIAAFVSGSKTTSKPPVREPKPDLANGNVEMRTKPKTKSPSGNRREQVTVYLDPNTAQRLRVYCAMQRREMSRTVDTAIQKLLDIIEKEGSEIA